MNTKSKRELIPMTSKSIIQLAFDEIASHITNLEEIRILIQDISGQEKTTLEIVQLLEMRLETAEVTLRTDLRILLNEIRHIQIRKSS